MNSESTASLGMHPRMEPPVSKSHGQHVKASNDEDTIVLTVNETSFSCAKRQLCKHSSYFLAMFNCKMKESRAKEVTLKDVEPEVMKLIVNYCNEENVALTTANICDLLRASCIYQIEGLVEKCCQFLNHNLEVSNCLGIIQLADMFALNSVYQKAHHFSLWHFVDMIEQEEYLQLPLQELVGYLSNENLNINGEVDVVTAILTWIGHEPLKRCQYATELLNVVYFDLLSTKQIQSIINNKLVMDSKQATNLVSGHFENHGKLTVSKVHQPRQAPQYLLLAAGLVKAGDKLKTRSEISAYDVNKKELKHLTRIPGNIAKGIGYQVCVVGKDICVCGGRAQLGRGDWYMNVWRYSSSEHVWYITTELLRPRRHHAVCASKKELFLIGGFGEFRMQLKSVDKYNTETGEWTELPSLLRPVFTASAVCLKDNLYVISSDVQFYENSTLTWSYIKISGKSSSGLSPNVALSQSDIYIIDKGVLRRLDLNTQEVKDEDKEVAFGPASTVNHRLYIITQEGQIQAYDPWTKELCLEASLDQAITNCFALSLPYYGDLIEQCE